MLMTLPSKKVAPHLLFQKHSIHHLKVAIAPHLSSQPTSATCATRLLHTSGKSEYIFPESSLSTGLYDSTFLKHPGEVIPKFDKLYSEYINRGYLKESSAEEQSLDDNLNVVRLLHSIHQKDQFTAWKEFQNLCTDDMTYLRQVPRIQWGFLLNIITSNIAASKGVWKKTNIIFQTMIKIGYQPTSIEYSKIIKAAAKTRKHDIVEHIWKYIRSSNAEMSTELWNSYIRATCNADETLWYRRFNRGNNNELKKNSRKEPVATNHAVNLVTQMIEEGITPNSRTFELVILYLGQAGELDYVKSLIHSLWGVSLNSSAEENNLAKLQTGDLSYPTISTLSSIINAFGVSDQFLIGLQIMEKLQKQYNIVLDGSSASLQLWKSMMRWAFWTSEPWGNTSPFALELIWKTVVETYKIQPNGSMIHYKILRELCRRDYDSAASLIPMFLESSNVKYPSQHVLQSLKKVARGYIRIGREDKCLNLLKNYESLPEIYQEVFEDIQRYNKPSIYGKFSSDVLSLEHFEAAADELYNVEEPEQLKSINLAV